MEILPICVFNDEAFIEAAESTKQVKGRNRAKIKGEFSYEALKASEPRNELFKAFKERKVIYFNMKQTPYYEISPVAPDVLLKDFVAIFHPELVESDYTPTFYYLLK